MSKRGCAASRIATGRLFSTLALILVLAQPALAVREPFIPAGRADAKSAALGGSAVALPGEASSIFVNPASLSQLDSPELSAGLGGEASGDERQYGLAGVWLLPGRFALAAGAAGLPAPGNSSAGQNMVLASLAFPLSQNGKLLAGFSAKYLTREVPGLGSGSGGGVDLGLLYEAWSSPEGLNLQLGATLTDAQTILKNANWEIQLPNLFRFGGALHLADDSLVTLSLDSQSSSVPEFDNFQAIRAGVEQVFHPGVISALVGRLGCLKRFDQAGIITAGFGLDYTDWRLDYALQIPTSGSEHFQTLTLSYGFARILHAKPAAENDFTPASAPLMSSATVPAVQATLTPKPTETTSLNLFSALESAAGLEDSVRVLPEGPRPTPMPSSGLSPVKPAVTENQSYASHLPIPDSPADHASASSGSDLGLPSSFTSYLSDLRSSGQSLRIEHQALRLQVVVNPFSPNNDGRKDKTLFIGRLESDSLRPSRWVLSVIRMDRVYRTYRGNGRLPYNLEWDGTDERGKVLPEGAYDVLLRVLDENGLELSAATQPVEIRLKATPVKLVGPESAVLTGDKSDKPLIFSVPKIRRSQDWQFIIYNPSGRKIFERTGGSEVPEKFSWSPEAGGKIAAAGRYRAALNYFDEAEAKGHAEARFRVSYGDFEVGLEAEPVLFQPGTGLTFKPAVKGGIKAVRWTLAITEAKQDQPLRVFEGSGQPPGSLAWDGKDGGGRAVSGGKVFQAVFNAVSATGAEDSVESEALQSDLGEYTGKQALSINLVRVQFDANSPVLDDASRKALADAAETLRRYPTDYQLRVIGHCEPAEKEKESELPRTRAQAVADFLAQDNQIPVEKIQTIGYGTEKLVSAIAGEEAKNRCTEVVLYAK